MSTRGYALAPVVTVAPSAPKVWSRAELAGLAEQERSINRLYGHGDGPSDWFWTRKLAEMDAALATHGAAA